uniref:MIP08456p n=1 Tax=Drosophila melanogaster TaxID=7227 RepID=C0PV52_DROME|nr:MIP08456p [Drosophila melanogaster]
MKGRCTNFSKVYGQREGEPLTGLTTDSGLCSHFHTFGVDVYV